MNNDINKSNFIFTYLDNYLLDNEIFDAYIGKQVGDCTLTYNIFIEHYDIEKLRAWFRSGFDNRCFETSTEEMLASEPLIESGFFNQNFYIH